MTRQPIKDAPPRLRQRQRADGTWRIWWEPETAVRKLGFEVVELDAHTPTRAAREARALNDQVATARSTGKAPATRRAGHTVDDLVGDYQRSVRFTQLAPATQRTYREKMRLIAAKWGPVPARDIDKPTMATWYETLCTHNGARQAQSLLAVVSILMSHAERRGWRDANSNPCLRLGMATPAPRAQIMGWAQLDALIAAAGACGLPSVGLAAALSMLAGQRQADVLAALRGDMAQQQVTWPGAAGPESVWVWDVLRSKRKTAGQIMLHPELVPMVTALLARPAPTDAHLIVEERVGRPYDKDLFAKRWAEVRAAAIAAGCTGLIDANGALLQFRDLRRTFSVTARAGGASVADAGDVLGNGAAMNPQLKRTYMAPAFFTAARAVDAVRRPTVDDDERKKA
jgi:hypothetical protein